ncbi:MAG TPA: PHP domain-containing protein [Anaerolineae bacterium]
MNPNGNFPTLKVDLHLHTCASVDGALHPAEVIKIAKRRGLDRICITDHNTIDGALAAQRIDPEFVIVGEEILTDLGTEILAFFVQEWVPPRLPPQEVVDRLVDQGAVISISHPFDPHRNQPWAEAWLEAILPGLDAVESFNARTIRAEDNERAGAFAKAHGLPTTAGSDAHTAMEIGAAFMEMPMFSTPDTFRAALPQAIIHGQLSPSWVHVFSTINKWRGRLGLKPRLDQR